jgi:hypothetical protein
MSTKGIYYVTVANRKDWTLSYPRHLWEAMTPGEQREVVARQQALFDAMAREGDGRPHVAARRPKRSRIPHARMDTPCKIAERAL